MFVPYNALSRKCSCYCPLPWWAIAASISVLVVGGLAVGLYFALSERHVEKPVDPQSSSKSESVDPKLVSVDPKPESVPSPQPDPKPSREPYLNHVWGRKVENRKCIFDRGHTLKSEFRDAFNRLVKFVMNLGDKRMVSIVHRLKHGTS